MSGLLLTVKAQADVVFSESFEGSTFGFSGMTQAGNTITYTPQNYTGPAPPNAGARYFYGGSLSTGTNEVSFSSSNISITTSNLTAAQIDAGLGQFNLSAWFSTFITSNPPSEYAYLQLQFKNGTGSNVGSLFEIGGQAFTGSISVSSGKRNWGQDVEINAIPISARQAVLTLYSYTPPGSTGDRDGYADLVSLDVSAVPEPGTLLLGGIAAACGGGGVWWKRRRRQPAVEPTGDAVGNPGA